MRGPRLIAVLLFLAGCSVGTRTPLEVAPGTSCAPPEIPGLISSELLRMTNLTCKEHAERLPSGSLTNEAKCDIPGASARWELSQETPLDPRFFIRKSSAANAEVGISLEPRVTRKNVGGYASGELACDGPARRIYVGNSLHGYFDALTAEGRRLWRAEIPGFRSIATGIDSAVEPNAEFIMEALGNGGSLLEKLSVSGTHVIAEYRTGDLQFHAIYHRSGALLMVLGPWNGVQKQAVPGGWRFYWARSEEPGAHFFSDGELDILVHDDVADPLVEYLLASVTPTRSGARLEWSMCPGHGAPLSRRRRSTRGTASGRSGSRASLPAWKRAGSTIRATRCSPLEPTSN